MMEFAPRRSSGRVQKLREKKEEEERRLAVELVEQEKRRMAEEEKRRKKKDDDDDDEELLTEDQIKVEKRDEEEEEEFPLPIGTIDRTRCEDSGDPRDNVPEEPDDFDGVLGDTTNFVEHNMKIRDDDKRKRRKKTNDKCKEEKLEK